MNDLKLLTTIEKRFDNAKNPIELFSFDSNMNEIYVSDHEKVFKIENDQLKEVFDLVEISNSGSNKLISFQFLTESNNISLISTIGDISLLNVINQTTEGVGSISDGLIGAQWSPDQELLALVTTSNALILMTKDFDIVSEQKISTTNKIESTFVNVGWGSYETQFKGSLGKNATKTKTEEKLLDWDDKKARISWRSDGEYFVVHFVDQDESKATASRKFQVFTRDGILHSNIEDQINVLEGQISWTYSKLLIASSIQHLNKHEIMFFERNGLSHGSFPLPFAYGRMKVNGIYWNIDSTVLCVWSELASNENSEESVYKSVVQLWTTSNYHWYLKQSYNFELDNKVTVLSWDPEDSYKLHLITSKGNYLSYKLAWTVNYCKEVQDYNGSIAVIDSSNALITPFKQKVIPPPMSLFKLECQVPINKLIWSGFNMDILAYLMNGDLVFFSYQKVKDELQNGFKLGSFDYKIVSTTKLGKDLVQDDLIVQHIIWPSERELIIIGSLPNSSFQMIQFDYKLGDDNKCSLEKKFETKLDYEVLNTDYNPQFKCLALQSTDGVVYKYVKEDKSAWKLTDAQFKFPRPCPNFNLLVLKNEQKDAVNNNHICCVGLSQLYRLYVDKVEIANNANSYYIHDEYILYTDHSNVLKFVDMRKINKSGKIIQEETLRRLERGAKVLTAIHSDTGCLLQMPRGNLELIHPRTLLISKLKTEIDAHKYLTAVETMRKHRVNMNLLYDHSPENFLKNIARFVKEVNNANLINLFLTELSEEDTTSTFFKDHYSEKRSVEVVKKTAKSKVREVCSKLIEICENEDSSKFYLVVLSCYAKMKELEKALHRVIQTKTLGQSHVDEGLRHLLYIVDVNELFDVALGTYDFDIVLMVAEKSQKDPKEYLPFLNDLKKLEENYRKYKIDLYLKRYKKALQSIIKCGADYEQELLKLVESNKLFSEALKYYKPTDSLFQKISKSFAAHLGEKKYYDEAGLVLFRAELYQDALDLFLKSANWHMFTNVCLKLKYPTNVYLEKLNTIIEKLKGENKHLECASVYEKFLNDTENAILCLIDGYHWFEAINLMHKSNRLDFLETNLLPSLKSHQQDTLKSLEQYEKKFLDDMSRLKLVREEKLKKREKELENDLDEDGRLNDDMSVSEMSASTFDNESTVGSVKSSTSTIASTSSTKMKKKRQKRNLISLKKGSPFEDLALIQELSDTISYVYLLKDDIFNLSKALMLYNLNDLCIELQNRYEMLIDLVEANTGDIWNYPIAPTDARTTLEAFQTNSLPTDFTRLDTKYRFPPEPINKRSWKLHHYE